MMNLTKEQSIHYFSLKGYTDELKNLGKLNDIINNRSVTDWGGDNHPTPLYRACESGQSECVKVPKIESHKFHRKYYFRFY
jgi:hypothetical protein